MAASGFSFGKRSGRAATRAVYASRASIGDTVRATFRTQTRSGKVGKVVTISGVLVANRRGRATIQGQDRKRYDTVMADVERISAGS